MNISRFIERNLRWIFPMPAVLFILLMMVFPVLYTLYVSLTDWDMSLGGLYSFVGLNNYMEMLTDPRFYQAVFRTFYFTILAVVIETVLGVMIALILNRDFRGKNLAKFFLLLPIVATPVAIGICWTLFYEPTIGLANYVLKMLGLPVSTWLASQSMVIPSLVLVDIWQWTPMISLIVLAGLAALPKDPFEAAAVDGANNLQMIFRISLPLLYPSITVATLLRAIDALKTFDIIYSMTGGGPGLASETMNVYSYSLGFGYFRFGAASASLIAFFLIVLGCSVFLLKARNFQET
jgi:multiple sugar transport system permease protein